MSSSSNLNLTPKNRQSTLATTNPVRLPETVNALAAMAGLALSTQSAYKHKIEGFLAYCGLPADAIALDSLDIPLTVKVLIVHNVKIWLGSLKASGLGKESLGQGKAAVVWLADLFADLGCIDHSVPATLSRVKLPRAESGQRSGKWLTLEEVQRLLQVAETNKTLTETMRARDSAILALLVICGLRCEEVAEATWPDITKLGDSPVLKVHGKGEKMRPVKLPLTVIEALDLWRKVSFASTRSGPIFLVVKATTGQVVYKRSLTTDGVRRIVDAAGNAAGFTNLNPHDLRRTFAQGAYESGASHELIRQTLGHESVVTTEHYINARIEFDRAATDIFADALKRMDGDV